jgi:hypothetical protein
LALIDTQRFIRTSYFFAARISGTRVLSCTRSPAPLSDLPAVDAGMDEIVEELGRLDRDDHDLLLDLRAEGPVADEEVQRRYRDRRAELLGGFRRVAVLSTWPAERDDVTAAGKRFGVEVHAFFDEKVALGWLRG